MQSKATPTVVGIDIGAFSAKIAAVQRGAIEIITNEANFRETPSVVGFGQGQRKIGQLGNVKLKSNFKNTIVSPTRYLGLKQGNQSVKIQLDNCPCPNKFQNGTLHFKVNLNGLDQSFAPQQILASFMGKLQTIIQHNDLDDNLIMLSIPSFYTQVQKEAFMNAAEIAGLKNVKMVAQPIAIGLDYGGFKKAEMGEGKNVVFIDFGHSKLSINLIKFTQTKMQIVCQQANRNLGCRDIDKKVFQFMSKKFEQKAGLNIKQSKRACLKLLQAIQKQRKILSGISQTDISVQSLFEDQDFSEPFTRQILINCAIQIFEQISKCLQKFRDQVTKLGVKIDSVQLVGGGSRIPKFIQIVEQVFAMSSSRTTNSSETIARGAALAAVQQSSLFRFHTFSIQNRALLPINISWDEQKEGLKDEQLAQSNKQTILIANQYIPCTKTVKIPYLNNLVTLISYQMPQSQVQSRILKLQCENSSNQETKIKSEDTKQEDNSRQLLVTIQISQNGIVSVTSIVDSKQKKISFNTKNYMSLSPQQISAYKAKEREMFTKDFHTVKSYEKKNQLEAFIYKQRQAINKDQFKKYVMPEQIKQIQEIFTSITQGLANESQQENKMGIKDYQNKKAEVQKKIKLIQQTAKKRKQTIIFHLKQLQNLKIHAADTIKQIQQRYRNSKPVQDTCEGIKQIQKWAEQTIKQSKTKNVSQLPLASKQQIQEQYTNIKQLINQMLNPQKQKQPASNNRHQHYEQQYDPDERYKQQQRQQQARQQQTRYAQQPRRQQNQFYEPEQMFYTNQRRPQQQYYYQQPQYYQPPNQQRRKQQQQQQQYDPFGMSRSGFFGPSNGFFGNTSGFW